MNKNELVQHMEEMLAILKSEGNANATNDQILAAIKLGYEAGVQKVIEKIDGHTIEISHSMDIYTQGISITGELEIEHEIDWTDIGIYAGDLEMDTYDEGILIQAFHELQAKKEQQEQ